MGKMRNEGAGLLCAFCHHKLVDQKEIVPHTYKNQAISQSGDLALNGENAYEGSERKKPHGRSSST